MLANVERPLNFDSVVGQEEIVNNIRLQSKRDKFFQVYILGGQFGAGKTTISRIISRAVNCSHKDENGNPCLKCPACQEILSGVSVDVIEMDAASNTGVDAIRNLKETVSFLPVSLKKKVYIIDEVHMLSNGAFNALLKVLEEPPEHVIFILCTTEVKKIPATVRSRAAKYQFSQISEDDMLPHLVNVANKHGIEYDEKGLRLICRNSEGAMRNALALLEQVGGFGKVTEEAVASILGIADPKHLFEFLSHLVKGDRNAAIADVNRQLSAGKDGFLLISETLDICADCVLAAHGALNAVNGTSLHQQMVQSMVQDQSAEIFANVADGLMQIRNELRSIPGKTTLVCGIIRMLSDKGSAVVSSLSARITFLEKEIEELKSKAISDRCVKVPAEAVSVTEGVWEADETHEAVKKPVEEGTNSEKKSEEDTENIFEERIDNESEENVEDEIDEESEKNIIQEEPVAEQENVSATETADVPMTGMDMMRLFCMSAPVQNTVAKKEETAAKSPQSSSKPDTKEDVEKYIKELISTEPLMKNVLMLACTRREENGVIVFETKQSPVFGILQKWENAKTEDGFPFKYRLVENT